LTLRVVSPLQGEISKLLRNVDVELRSKQKDLIQIKSLLTLRVVSPLQGEISKLLRNVDVESRSDKLSSLVKGRVAKQTEGFNPEKISLDALRRLSFTRRNK
jgi:hypothetical protein